MDIFTLLFFLLALLIYNWQNLMQRADSFEKILRLEKTEGKRRRGQQRMKWLGSITDSVDIRHNLGTKQELCKFKVYRIMIWLTSWNDYHNKFSEHPSSQYRYVFKKIRKTFVIRTLRVYSLNSQLSYIMCSHINYIYHVVHPYYLSYNWKFVVLFDCLHPIPPTLCLW